MFWSIHLYTRKSIVIFSYTYKFIDYYYIMLTVFFFKRDMEHIITIIISLDWRDVRLNCWAAWHECRGGLTSIAFPIHKHIQ